jgi:hypothetical protein
LPEPCGSGKVLYDTGAGIHIHPDIAAFDRGTVRAPTTPTYITTAGGARTLVQRIGDAYVVLTHRGVDTLLVLRDAICEPSCPHVLLSGCLATDAGFIHDSVRQTLVAPGSFGDVSRLAYSKERVLEFEGAVAVPTQSVVRALVSQKCVVATAAGAVPWRPASTPYASKTLSRSSSPPLTRENGYLPLENVPSDYHDTYDARWSAPAAPPSASGPAVAGRASRPKRGRKRGVRSGVAAGGSAPEPVDTAPAMVATREQPRKDYRAVAAGRPTPVRPLATPATFPQPLRTTSTREAVRNRLPPPTAPAQRANPLRASAVPFRAPVTLQPGGVPSAAATVRPTVPPLPPEVTARQPPPGAVSAGATAGESVVPTLRASSVAARAVVPPLPPEATVCPLPPGGVSVGASAGVLVQPCAPPCSASDDLVVNDYHPPGYEDGNDDRALTAEAFAKVYAELLGIQPSVDLFATKSNAHCTRFYTAEMDAFTMQWSDEDGHANPPFARGVAAAAVKKGYVDWLSAMTTTSFTIFLPRWRNSPHTVGNCPELAAFRKLYTFQPGSLVFTKPGPQRGSPRVPCGPLPWPVDVFHLARAESVLADVTPAATLHRRLCHMGTETILRAAAAGSIRLGAVTRAELQAVCASCAVCRVANASRPMVTDVLRERSKRPFDLVMLDVLGPFNQSIDGFQYMLAFRNDCTRWAAATLIRTRGDVAAGLETLLTELKNELGRHSARSGAAAALPHVGVLQCDNAVEFTAANGKFAKTCRRLGIALRFSGPYSHHSQGIIERHWQTIQCLGRAALYAASLDSSWWSHALRHANWMVNRLPSASGPSPYQRVTGVLPDLADVKTFGCTSYVFTDPSRRTPAALHVLVPGTGVSTKLADRARECRYVGEASDSNCQLHVPVSDPRLLIRSNQARYDERSTVSGVVRAAPAHSAFDVVPPPSMLAHAVDDFTIVKHRTMRRREVHAAAGEVGDELIAIFCVKCPAYPRGVWTEPRYVFDCNPAGFDTLMYYLQGATAAANPYYPLFSVGTYRPVGARHAGTPCVVLGIDLRATDGLPVLVAVQPKHGDDFSLLDVPRDTVTVARSPHLAAFSVTASTELRHPLPFILVPAYAVSATPDVVVGVGEPALRPPRTAAQAWLLDGWRAASLTEIDTLELKGTFTYVERSDIPEGVTPLMCQFKYAIKYDEHGNVEKLKARLIAHGM